VSVKSILDVDIMIRDEVYTLASCVEYRKSYSQHYLVPIDLLIVLEDFLD
jgi:hypothetical protein